MSTFKDRNHRYASIRYRPALAITALFFVVLAASLALATGVAWGQNPVSSPNPTVNPVQTPNPTVTPQTSVDKLRSGRFGLNAVASLLGLTKCDDTDYINCTKPPDLRQVVLKLIQVILGFTSLIALIFVLYGGFTWVTAMGNNDKVNKGRDILIWAGIGLFVVMFAWGLITYIIYTSSRVIV